MSRISELQESSPRPTLKFIADPYSPEQHKKMDEAILGFPDSVKSVNNKLLGQIILGCNSRALDLDLARPTACQSLLNDNPEMTTLLEDCRKSNSFRKIRLLGEIIPCTNQLPLLKSSFRMSSR